MYNYITKQR